MKSSIMLLLLLSKVPLAMGQTSPSCKSNHAVVGPCFSIRGKMYLANGTPSIRISKLGSKRILGVVPAENEIIPSNLRKALKDFSTDVYGTFNVCPMTKEKAGEMQSVCVESAENLVPKSR